MLLDKPLERKTLIIRPALGQQTETRQIKGPLGLWPFPFINALLQFIYALRYQEREYLPGLVTRRTEYIRNAEGRIIERYEEITID
jgi:hypothetical protein